MPWEDRIKTAYRDAPWCSGIALLSALVWLCLFLGWSQPMAALGGTLDLEHPWRWITYPLANPLAASSFIWFAIGLFFFVLFISELEVRWGSLRFLRVFTALTLLAAGLQWAGVNLVARLAGQASILSIELWGMTVPAAALFMMWCALNSEATVMFMLVFPIKAKYLALIDLAWVFFNDDHVAGICSSLVLAGSWLWARRYGGNVLAAGPKGSPVARLRSWWLARRRLQRKGRFHVLEGGAGSLPMPRMGDLKVAGQKLSVAKEDPTSVELDRILDKIRFEGMNSLSPEERSVLDRQSQRLRDKS